MMTTCVHRLGVNLSYYSVQLHFLKSIVPQTKSGTSLTHILSVRARQSWSSLATSFRLFPEANDALFLEMICPLGKDISGASACSELERLGLLLREVNLSVIAKWMLEAVKDSPQVAKGVWGLLRWAHLLSDVKSHCLNWGVSFLSVTV